MLNLRSFNLLTLSLASKSVELQIKFTDWMRLLIAKIELAWMHS